MFEIVIIIVCMITLILLKILLNISFSKIKNIEKESPKDLNSNAINDHRAITIEVASDATHPYAITKEAYKGLIKLLVDICKRNDIKKLRWKADKSLIGQVDKQNMTVHRWFTNTACPGDYLYEIHGKIADDVNAQLGVKDENFSPYKVRVEISDLNIRKGPGTNYNTTDKFTGKGVFTIVEVRIGKGSNTGWGRLKSGVGWISLDYTTKV